MFGVQENGCEGFTGLLEYEFSLWASLRLPREGSSTGQIRDSTAPCETHLSPLFPSCRKLDFLIRFALLVVISLIFAVSQWITCRETHVSTPVVPGKFVSHE